MIITDHSQASIETGKEVEWTSEDNYHFRLSAFQEKLDKHYSNSGDIIIPWKRQTAVLDEIRRGLNDLSISRPSERLRWGIPVPDDASQTIYVWLDALINYLTKANYPFQIPGKENAAGWPADCHVIGKDIIRFHCIYWPAFLMALDLPLPKQIFTHAHWTLGDHKMSKSTGMVVNPFFAINRFGVDCMRYYLAIDGGTLDDSRYDNSFIISRYKKGLQGGLGNLVRRLIRGKGWDVRRAVKRSHTFIEHLKQKPHTSELDRLQYEVFWCMKQPAPREALQKIMEVIFEVCVFSLSHKPQTDSLDECIHAVSRTVGSYRTREGRAARPHHLHDRGFTSNLRYFAPTVHAGEDETASGYAWCRR